MPQPTNIEEWRPIPGYEGRYEVSNYGSVRSLDRVIAHPYGGATMLRGKVLKPGIKKHGYKYVVLPREGGGQITKNVHSLVAITFLPAPELPGMLVRHLDDDPSNNYVGNLSWGTYADNADDCIKNGNHAFAKRDHCGRGHKYTAANTRFRGKKNNARECIACSRARAWSTRYPEWKPRMQELSDKYFEKINR